MKNLSKIIIILLTVILTSCSLNKTNNLQITDNDIKNGDQSIKTDNQSQEIDQLINDLNNDLQDFETETDDLLDFEVSDL